MKGGIAVRIAIIFSGLLLIGSGTTGYMVYQGAESSLTRSSTERLAHTAEIVRVRMLASIEATTKDVRFLASTPPVQGIVRARLRRGLDPETALLDREWRTQLEDIFKVFLQNRPSYVKVSFIELRRGPLTLVSSEQNRQQGQEETAGADVDKTLPLDSTLTPGYVYLSDIEMVEAPGDAPPVPMIYAAMPVFAQGGALYGAVTASIDLRELLGSLTSVVGPDKSLLIANADGELLTAPEGPYTIDLYAGTSRFRIDEIFRSHGAHSANVRSVEQLQEDDHHPGIAYFDRFPYDALNKDRHVRMAVVSPTSTILEVVNEVQKRSALIVLIFSLGGALIALALSRLLTRPLSRITEALSHFGDREWDVDLPAATSDEIGVLVGAFNKMAGHIRYQLGVLEEKERHQRIILETAAEGIIVADRHGHLEVLNPAAERLFGYPSDELIGTHVNMLLPPAAQEWTDENDDRRLSWRDVGTGHEVVGRRKDGTEMQVSLSVSEFELEKETKYALFFEDITDRKEYERALRTAKEKAEEMAHLKTTFLANMSHELRTPLTAVIGYASMLAEDLSEEHERFAQLIEHSGRRLMDTLNAVLSLAQLESQQMTVELDVLNVSGVVEETARFFETQATSKGLAFRHLCSPGARGAHARVDRGALNSVLQNIVGNAIKFTENGFVEIRTHVADEHIHIEVRDSGIGIDPAFLPHLFDTFRQESTGHERTHEGSGLGLALTKRLVDLMDGDIDVHSVKREGTSITVSFPLVRTGLPAATQQESAEFARGDWTEAQILVVEDNAETALLLRSVLSVAGDVTLAFTGAEALRKISRMAFDFVLCDINLGSGASGVEVLNAIRGNHDYDGVPVVAVTAYALPGDQERFLQQGFDDYVSKPFTPDELVGRVYQLLHRSGESAPSPHQDDSVTPRLYDANE